MSRDEEASLNARAEEAKRRLCRGIESSKPWSCNIEGGF
jgi:hypothetical protein